MAKKATAKQVKSQGVAKPAETKIERMSRNEAISARESMLSLEKSYADMVDSISKNVRDVEYEMRRATIDYELELRVSCSTKEVDSKLQEINKTFYEKQFELAQSHDAKRKEMSDDYLHKLKKGWAELQASNPDFSEIGDIGHVFWDLASRAQHIN